MEAREVKTKSGKTMFVPHFEDLSELEVLSEESVGFCLACGEEAHGVEPDARRYECECCGEPKVYGLEELMMMGLVR